MILYHGTSVEALKGIETDGCMIPNKVDSSRAVAEGWAEKGDHEGFVFFTDLASNAIHYSTYATANGLGVAHESFAVLLKMKDFKLTEGKMEDYGFMKEFKVEGNVSLDKIDEVLFFCYETEEILARCSFSEWKQTLKMNNSLGYPE